MKKLMIKTFAVLASCALFTATPTVLPVSAVHASGFTELNHIPVILGLKKGTKIKTTGLATGDMTFTKVTPQHLQIHQEITLIPIGRKAIETVVGKTLTTKDNRVTFRFDVVKQKDGSFEYSLYDQGDNQLLVKGPVKVLVGTTRSNYQELEFQAVLVKMNVKINKDAKNNVDGSASFALGIIPVPGSLDFKAL